MKKTTSLIPRLLILALATALASAPALADKGGKHGNKHDDHDQDRYQADDRRGRGDQLSIEVYFGSNDRRIINDYYGNQFRAGNCPPGLAKKNNGCMPPGQARKWHKGKPLPQGLAYYPLPADLVYRLPPAPPRHQYVRVASDILLIAVGTSMVVDAIQDIGR